MAKEPGFSEFLEEEPSAASLQEALGKMQEILDEAAEIMRRRDEAYARQLSELVRSNPSAAILAMMGSGHERALTRHLDNRGVAYTAVRQQSSLPSPYSSISLGQVENGEHLNRLDLLRCLAEYFPLRQFMPFEQRSMFMKAWIQGKSEAELAAFLTRIYST